MNTGLLARPPGRETANRDDEAPIAAAGGVSAPVISLPPASIAGGPASRRGWLAVAGLLAAYAVMAVTASRTKGLSFDEGLQLAVGYNIWLNDDYRIEGANGDLVKRWATLPFLVSRPHFVGADDPYWKGAMAYNLGDRFFFELGNTPENLLRQGRAMITLLGVAAGLLVFWCSRELFGFAGGLVSLVVFVFSPHMLAFGGVVSTDLSITLTLFGSTWCIWRLLHEVTAGRLLASLAFCGLMVLAKPTALVIFPITAVLLAVKLIAGGPLIMSWRDRRWIFASRRGQAGVMAALALGHVLAGWTAIWAHYGFRYAASPNPADPSLVWARPARGDRVPPSLSKMMQWIERTHFLPEGFHRGIEALLRSDDAIVSFMNGEWTVGGRPAFFPYAIWVKTHPSLMVLAMAGGVACWGMQRQARGRISGTAMVHAGRPGLFYALTPHVALIACYLAVAMTEDFNIGHRHVLPIYPSLHVLAGAVVTLGAWRTTWLKGAVTALLAWLAVDSLGVWPHYLSYFAPQAGGPEKGYQHLVDSSLDWGMNLPALRDWLDQNDPGHREPVFLSYFGADNPKYHGIHARHLPGFFNRDPFVPSALEPGCYVISATLFQGLYTDAFGPWNSINEELYQAALRKIQAFERIAPDPVRRTAFFKRTPPAAWRRELRVFDELRFARLCAWLRHHGAPPIQIGYTFLVWKLDSAALIAAILGPPAELVDVRPILERYRAEVTSQ